MESGPSRSGQQPRPGALRLRVLRLRVGGWNGPLIQVVWKSLQDGNGTGGIFAVSSRWGAPSMYGSGSRGTYSGTRHIKPKHFAHAPFFAGWAKRITVTAERRSGAAQDARLVNSERERGNGQGTPTHYCSTCQCSRSGLGCLKSNAEHVEGRL